jgi:hypothetical protein
VRSATTTQRAITALTVRSDSALRLVSFLLALAALLVVLAAPHALLSTWSASDESAPHVIASSAQQIDTSNEQLPGGDADDSSPSGILQFGDVAEVNGDDELGEILQLTTVPEGLLPTAGQARWSVQPVLAAARVSSHIPLLQSLRGPPAQNS